MTDAEPELKAGLPIIAFATPANWEDWLREQHESSKGLWLKLAKKGSETATVNYQQALELALCYGWIDGQKAAYDGHFWLQRFTPRGAKSVWSQINREKVEALLGAGRMKPAGIAQVEKAKADGRLDAAYASQKSATVPDDLREALEKSPKAQAFFDSLNSANRYAILYRLQDAKKPETRARRLAQFVEMLEEGKKLHP